MAAMNEQAAILAHWIVASGPIAIKPAPGGFSDAHVWRVDADGRAYALRQWPVDAEPTRLRTIHAFAGHLAAEGVLLFGTTQQRWVTHLDVAREDIERAIASVDRFFARQGSSARAGAHG